MSTYPVGERRRSDILDAAEQLFFERGFHAVSIDDVARSVGCSKGSVLYHFATKVHILGAIVEPVVLEYDQLRAHIRGLSPSAMQATAIAGLIDMVLRHPRASAIIRKEVVELLRHEPMSELLRSGAFLPKALAGGRVDQRANVTAMFAIYGATGAGEFYGHLSERKLRAHLTASLSTILTPLLREPAIPTAWSTGDRTQRPLRRAAPTA